MPRLRRPRIFPSTFKTKDGKYLYVFGGEQDGIERYDTIIDYHQWQLLQISFPNHLIFGHFSTLPMYKLKNEIPGVNIYKILIFGSKGDRNIFTFDT